MLVVVAMTGLIMMAGSFGHTHRLNADLTAPAAGFAGRAWVQ